MKFAAIYLTPENVLLRYDFGKPNSGPMQKPEIYWRAWQRPQEEIRGLTLVCLIRLCTPDYQEPEVIINGAWSDTLPVMGSFS